LMINQNELFSFPTYRLICPVNAIQPLPLYPCQNITTCQRQ
jgi:hypothetical protein